MPDLRITYPSGANIRQEPSTNARILGGLPVNALVKSATLSGEWWAFPVYVHQSVVESIDPQDRVVPGIPLPAVPYHSQWEAGAQRRNADCGQACCKMLLDWKRVANDHNVDQLGDIAGSPAGWTGATDLATILNHFGLSAGYGQLLYPQTPFIALVKYSYFTSRADKFTGLHWIVVLDMNDRFIVCHDPDYYGEGGKNKAYPRSEFDAAYGRGVCVWLEEHAT